VHTPSPWPLGLRRDDRTNQYDRIQQYTNSSPKYQYTKHTDKKTSPRLQLTPSGSVHSPAAPVRPLPERRTFPLSAAVPPRVAPPTGARPVMGPTSLPETEHLSTWAAVGLGPTRGRLAAPGRARARPTKRPGVSSDQIRPPSDALHVLRLDASGTRRARARDLYICRSCRRAHGSFHALPASFQS
jgi:hypothetical protein